MEKILIIGTGGVGGYFGGRMAQAGLNVTFLARGLHYKEIQKNGLKVKSINGTFHIPKINLVSSLKNLDQMDLIFICTKAPQVEEITPLLIPLIHKNTIVIPLLNGITAEKQLTNHIAQSQIVHGLVKIFSKIDSPGVINHFGYEPTLIFGNYFHENNSFLNRLEFIIKTANITYKRSEDILSDKWQKFIFICSGGLTTLAQSTYGEVRSNKETRALLIQVLKEIYTLGINKGINLPKDLIEKTIKMIDAFPYEATSSMQRDFYNKTPSEIDFLTGTVVKLGKEINSLTPLNQIIYSCLKIQEQKLNKL